MIKLALLTVLWFPPEISWWPITHRPISVDAQVERLDEVMGLLLGDDFRDAAKELTKTIDLDTRWGKAKLTEILATFESKLDDYPQWCDESDKIRGRLTLLRFDVDPQLADSTVTEIVNYFRTNRCLDPRIISMEREDPNTVKIITGESDGPLSGGGCIYKARLENRRWMVRLSSLWIS